MAIVKGFVVDCSPEQYTEIVEAAGGEDKMDAFILAAVMAEVSYIKGMDQLYLDEYAKKEGGGTT
jgi:acetolactate synthase small subunit